MLPVRRVGPVWPREMAAGIQAGLGSPPSGRGRLLMHDRSRVHRSDRTEGGRTSVAGGRLSPGEVCICSFGNARGATGIRQDRAFGYIADNERLRTLYCAADVLVFPSIQEAFGKVAAEALACGTPVVAFDATGPRDIVRHKQTGYAARPFDPADLASGVRWLLADRDRLLRIGNQAAADARERFSPATAAGRYRELYREIIESA